MNVRTGELAADVAFSANQTPSIPVALICAYNGAALPSKAVVDGWARPTLLGFESSTTRPYSGGSGGPPDATFTCNVFDTWGYPADRGSWCCAADSPSTDPVFLPNVREYGRTYALTMLARARLGPIVWYGNPAAVEAACAGTRDAGLVALRWGVGTWGYGEGRGPNAPPASADVELLQSGNTPGPVPDSDLDWLYAAVNVFAAYGGPSEPPPSKPSTSQEPSPMLLIVQSDGFIVKKGVYYTNGVDVLRPVDSVNDYPQPFPVGNMTGAAADLVWRDVTTAQKRNRDLDAFLAHPPTGGTGTAGATADEVKAVVETALEHAQITINVP